jgi:antitoxin ParD1/3/4
MVPWIPVAGGAEAVVTNNRDFTASVVRDLRRQGVSIDRLTDSAVAEKLSTLLMQQYLAKSASRGTRARFATASSSVPAVGASARSCEVTWRLLVIVQSSLVGRPRASRHLTPLERARKHRHGAKARADLVRATCESLYPSLTKLDILRYARSRDKRAAMNVSLTKELERLVNDKVKGGLYRSASEVVREALRLLEERDRLQQFHLEELRRDIRKGLDSGPARPLALKALKVRVRQAAASEKRRKAG